MNGDQETFVKMMIQALGERWASLGAFAWVLLGLVLAGAVLLLVILLRWILRGGLSRRMAQGLSGQRPVEDQSERGHDREGLTG